MSDAAEPTFEDGIRRLGEIVERLERGDLPLEESLALFEEGVRLSRTAQARLDRAERRLDELLAVSPAGEPTTRPLPLGAIAGGQRRRQSCHRARRVARQPGPLIRQSYAI